MTFPLSSALTILKCSLFHSFLNTLYYSFDFSLRFFSVCVLMYVKFHDFYYSRKHMEQKCFFLHLLFSPLNGLRKISLCAGVRTFLTRYRGISDQVIAASY